MCQYAGEILQNGTFIPLVHWHIDPLAHYCKSLAFRNLVPVSSLRQRDLSVYGLNHGGRVFALEDVTSHIDTGSTVVNGVVAGLSASFSGSFLPPAITTGTGQAAATFPKPSQ